MILKIILLILTLLVLTLLILFLADIFSPAVKKQTDIQKDILLAKIEHKFDRLDTSELRRDITHRAKILCSCKKTFKTEPYIKSLKGQSCAVVNSLHSSLNDCRFSCIGLGDCIKECIQEAITIQNGTAVVNELCNGCGKCVDSCPKKLITLVPVSQQSVMQCSAPEGILTSCSDFHKTEKNEYSEKKGFKIWQVCYRIMHRTKQ